MLLKPSRELNQIIYGLVARSARLYGVGVCAFVFLSNHCHLLLRPHTAKQLSQFMGYLNGNLAREAGRLYSWREKFWGRRYTDCPVSFEAEAQVSRLEYLLAQGCKENLVDLPEEWPGATSIHALKSHEPIVGIWHDRTRRYRSGRGGRKQASGNFAEVETLDLVPLPCWDGLSRDELDECFDEILRKVKEESRRDRAEKGNRPAGRRWILRQHPHRRPRALRRTPSPGFHASSFEIRRMLETMYLAYLNAYRDAVDRLRDTLTPSLVRFPAHGIPPPTVGL